MAQSEKPVPAPDVDSAPYWAAAAAGELKLPTCRSCQTILFPPRSVCPQCLGSEVDWTALSGRAAVHSFGIMHDSFIKGFEPPYIVASVELEEQAGLRLTTNIVVPAANERRGSVASVRSYVGKSSESSLESTGSSP